MVAAKTEITSKELIKPSSPTPHEQKHHKLSFLDQFQSPIYVPLIFFYQNQNHSFDDQPTISRRLKQSLADVLTKFNHLAGRIIGNLSVHCNDLGALFVEAKARAALSSAIKNAPVAELNRYLPLDPYAAPDPNANTNDAPLLAVQISSFECGGTAVGVCISHKVADISSLMKFLNYWAALTRGEKIDADPRTQPVSDLPAQLFPGVPEDSSFPNYLNVGGNKEKLVCKRFLFDKEKMAALKKLAASDEHFGLQVNNPSRVEALSGFLWKQFIDISRAKGETKSLYVASHTVNLRSRMKSLTSTTDDQNDNIFGNFFVYAPASLPSWASGNHFQELVWMLRTTIRRIDGEFIKLVQSGVPYLDTFFKGSGKLRSDPEEINVCYFTSWCRLPFYEVDFGWGKPLTVCTSATGIKNGVILMSTKSDDGIEAWITMTEDEIRMIPDDLLSLETTSYY